MMLTAALLALAPIVAMSGREMPTTIVQRLLEASAKEDWPAVLTMLTTDAQLGMGDVGGPLNKETVSILGQMEKYGCRITSIRDTPNILPVKYDTLFVEVKRTCPYGAVLGKSGEHEISTIYFVKGQKVAGFYIQINSPPTPQ